VLEITSNDTVIRFEYDAEGNLISRSGPDGKWTYRWNSFGMLECVTNPSSEDVCFAYDCLGRRVSKTYRGMTTRWLWDGNVPLNEWTESSKSSSGTDGRNGITWYFDDESYSPFGRIAGTEWTTIVTNYLGIPIELLDAEGNRACEADIDLWGRINRTEFAELCPFRFPGQYEDVETGLYYNGYRYYDPELGLYISQDPIGLEGGLRFYAYPADPLTFADPLGLRARECGPRRTKHVDNRHIDRKKYPDKGKYKKPNQVDKINDQTLSRPDRVIHQRGGRVRYEKDFGRKIGTRGQTTNVVVVDTKKNKIVTSFPKDD
jgi:RHS repeat-associated protein